VRVSMVCRLYLWPLCDCQEVERIRREKSDIDAELRHLVGPSAGVSSNFFYERRSVTRLHRRVSVIDPIIHIPQFHSSLSANITCNSRTWTCSCHSRQSTACLLLSLVKQCNSSCTHLRAMGHHLPYGIIWDW